MKKKSWIIEVFILTFILSIVFSYLTNLVALNSSNIILILIIIMVIFIGIVFDMIGTSVLTAKEATFHAMATKKIKGAKTANKLIKNSVKVSSFCNDIIGDICGIVSGGLGTVLVVELDGSNSAIIAMLVAAFISSLTVGGKAIGKNIADKNADSIIFAVSKFISIFKKN